MTSRAKDTIFALSSGPPPAGIAVVRISGPDAGAALGALAGALPPPRKAVLRNLRHDGDLLDRALVLWLPGPATATGEDMAELHLHGGRAVVVGVEQALATRPRMRRAEGGEFTRRALYNGVIDLTAAEGLADLLEAETVTQRRAALALQSGGLARMIEGWRARLIAIAAQIEAGIDLAEEAEAADTVLPIDSIKALRVDIEAALARPPAERLKDGVRIVIAGPVNSGKSSLLNALIARDAAIATPIPGTTRDVLEVPIAIAGQPLLLVDTAGLRVTVDPIEAEGISRARQALTGADIVLWLGETAPPATPAKVLSLHARCDERDRRDPPPDRLAVSAVDGTGLALLRDTIVAAATQLLPRDGELALNERHRQKLVDVVAALRAALSVSDAVLVAASMTEALDILSEVSGRHAIEDVLDAVFSRFCVGK